MRFFAEGRRCLAPLDPEAGPGLRLWQLWDNCASDAQAPKQDSHAVTPLASPSVSCPPPVRATQMADPASGEAEAESTTTQQRHRKHEEQRRSLLAYVLLQTAPVAELRRRAWKPLAMLARLDQVKIVAFVREIYIDIGSHNVSMD